MKLFLVHTDHPQIYKRYISDLEIDEEICRVEIFPCNRDLAGERSLGKFRVSFSRFLLMSEFFYEIKKIHFLTV